MMSLAEHPTEQRFNRVFLTLCAGLLLLAPLYYQDNLGGEGLYIPFNNVVWIFAAFIIGLGLLKPLHTRQVGLPPLAVPLLFFLGATTLLGMIHEVSTPVAWLFRNLSIWGAVLLFFAIAQFPLERRWREGLLYLLVASSALQALIGLIHLTLTETPPTWLPQSPGIPRGIFQQQNLLATYLATGLAVCVYLVTTPGYKAAPYYVRGLLLSAGMLNTVILITTGSRIGLLSALLALLLLGASRWKILLRTPQVTLALLVALVIGAGIGTQLESGTGGLSKSLQKLEAVSTTSADPTRGDVRLMIYGSSWDLFKEAPLLGHGIGRFQKVWHDHKPIYHEQHPEATFLTDRLTHPHNEILFWALEGGLLALIGIAVVVAAFIRLLVQLGWQRGGGYLALMLPIALHTQVELPFYISQLHWLTLVLLLALAASHRVRRRPLPLSSMARSLTLTLAVAIPTLVTVFMTHSLLANRMLTQVTFTRPVDLNKVAFAARNLFYQDRAEFVRMQTQLRYGLATGDEAMVESYISWARDTLKIIPEAATMSALAVALFESGKPRQGAEVIERAILIYPTQPAVIEAEAYLRRKGLDFQAQRPAYLSEGG